MPLFKLTAFDKNGHKLLDESFQAATEEEAKQYGERILKEKELLEKTHRCTSSAGKLILFHV
jgi:hypothetical protein